MQQARQSAVDAQQTIQALVARHGEPAWLAERREAAWNSLLTQPGPKRVTHLWRYTDPGAFELDELAPVGDVAPVELSSRLREAVDGGELSAAAWAGGDGAVAVGVGEAGRKAGLTLMDLHAAAVDATHGPRVEEHLGRLVGAGYGRFEDANLALWRSGVYLHVPRGASIELPVHVVLRESTDQSQGASRLLAIVEADAQLTLVEEHLGGPDSEAVSHAVSEIVVGQGANVRYVQAQRLSRTVAHHATQRLELGQNAESFSFFTSFGGRVAKMDIGALLMGQGARSRMMGFLFAEGRQHFDHHTLHDHKAPHTWSDLDVKAVLGGHSRSVYTGVIGIDESAPYSEAYQENRNLLLSEDARADSIPELEISIDEVQCKHGATMGPVDRDQLFYLMARGVPEPEAIRQIVTGFLEPSLKQFPQEMAEPLREELARRLSNL